MGVHVDTITVTANVTSGSPAQVVDTLRVLAPLTVEVDRTSHADSAVWGSTVSHLDSVIVQISGFNARNTPFNWRHSPRATWNAWAGGYVASREPVVRIVQFWRRSPVGLATGLYVDTLSFTAYGVDTVTVTVLDSFRIVPAPLMVYPQSRVDSVGQGGSGLRADSASVVLTGSVAGTTAWVATHHGNRANWLVLVDSTGTGSAMLRWRRGFT